MNFGGLGGKCELFGLQTGGTDRRMFNPPFFMKITYSQFKRLPRHLKTEAYFNHPVNQAANKQGKMGPSVQAQADFVNNWQLAFFNFAMELPS